MKKIFTLFVLTLLLFTTPAMAFTITATGIDVEVNFTEPTTNSDGSTLADLDYCTIYYTIGSTTQSVDVPAVDVAGGEVKFQIVSLPILAGQEVDVDFWVTATDQSGNESVESVHVIKRIDLLAPSAPN